MNWIAFGYAMLGCALAAAMCGGISNAIDGIVENRPVQAAAGFLVIALTFSGFIGLIV